MKQKKMTYAAPELTLLELAVENGFGGSPQSTPDDYGRETW